ncbi:MAG: hypothetical protein KF914_13610 [Rhizobiaceae bacterium]|nr:hypothetical protein [Rhizobiaceae bacterium]
MSKLSKLLRTYMLRRGYTVTRAQSASGTEDYFLYGYADGSGSFDYERYKAVQTEGNKRKIDNVWTDRETIAFICDFLKGRGQPLRRGLCHGSRNGTEVRWFRELLGIDVTGTDISETAANFPHMVQWDFHERNPDWVGKFDFVYSNSHDHAYDPAKALEAWIGQLAPEGVLLLEHSTSHSEWGASELDPFGISPKLLPYVVLKFAGGRYCVTDLLEPSHVRPKVGRTWIFVLRPNLRS